MKNLVLIGMMGVAKSTVGRAVAEKLGLTFIDGDDEIERVYGEKISDMFARYGESEFRNREKVVYADLSKRQNTVIACGGGVVLSPENMQNLSSGVIIRLTATPEIIYERVKNNSDRPLIKDGGLEKIKQIASAREHLYSKYARFSVDNTALSVDECVNLVIKIYQQNA